jgi:hypothetical protein
MASEPVELRLKTQQEPPKKSLLQRLCNAETREEPFRARVFAEPASFAPLRTGFQRTAQMESWSLFQLSIFLFPSERN